MQALDFCFFWAKPKERALPAVRKREKYQVVARRYNKKGASCILPNEPMANELLNYN
ncbi:hypothetical protein [Pedobacter rhizosphaerae]|uniref:hypothetical protein n=1 Tax=Pedobacter rhizosphaerae TaxID=390241 RepID=UPI001C315481|nr:hypothetical protein [Pedobacter rhizosphaerae]